MSNQRKTATTLVSQRTYAKMRDVSSTWISKLVREGRLPTTAGRINVAKADKALATEATEKDGAVTLAEAERRWRLAIARLKELELQTRRGEVVLVAEVMRAQMQVNTNIRSRLLQLPSKMAQRLTGIESMGKIKVILEGEIFETLTELSRTAGNISELKLCSACEATLQTLAEGRGLESAAAD